MFNQFEIGKSYSILTENFNGTYNDLGTVVVKSRTDRSVTFVGTKREKLFCSIMPNGLRAETVYLGNVPSDRRKVYASDPRTEVVMIERVNIMTGKTYKEALDTPLCCSPASETYWCC